MVFCLDNKDYDKKNLFADYYASDECKNPDSYGTVCVKCGECGRTFTKDGILKENENNGKKEEDNTGYITQATRHSMLVSLSREINVISDENAVLYDTIIKLCQQPKILRSM